MQKSRRDITVGIAAIPPHICCSCIQKKVKIMQFMCFNQAESTRNSWPLLVTTRRWPRPLNRGGPSMEVLSIIIYTKYFWDFDMWPFNRVWPLNGGPLNGGPLNGGSTVVVYCVLYVFKKMSATNKLKIYSFKSPFYIYNLSISMCTYQRLAHAEYGADHWQILGEKFPRVSYL